MHSRFSDAVHATFSAIASDLENSGLDANDVRQVAALAMDRQEILNGITDARLLHGDLWIGNVMIAAGKPAPRISGVFDCDRTSWGDHMADWTMYLLERRSPSEQQHFWDGYGEAPPDSEHARIRRQFYKARSLGEARLEYQRLRLPENVTATYPAMNKVLALLNTLQR